MMNLDQIRADVEKAREIEILTPLWTTETEDRQGGYVNIITHAAGELVATLPACSDCCDVNIINADVIVDSRTLLPQLAKHCEVLMREIEIRNKITAKAIYDAVIGANGHCGENVRKMVSPDDLAMCDTCSQSVLSMMHCYADYYEAAARREMKSSAPNLTSTDAECKESGGSLHGGE